MPKLRGQKHHRKAELEHEARLAGNYQGDISTSGGLGGMPEQVGRQCPAVKAGDGSCGAGNAGR